MVRRPSVIGTYGPVVLIAITVAGLGVGAWFLIPDPVTVGILWAISFPAAIAAMIVGRRTRATAQREWRLRSEIEAAKLRFEEERSAWREHQAAEQRRLEALETRIVDQAAALAWSPEPIRHAPVEPELIRRDEDVDRLIESTTDRVFEALREGKYVRNERFEGRLFWEDVGTLVRDVAAIYEPGGNKAWLETDARKLALAVHRAALRISMRLEQLPTAPSSRKLSDIVKWTETYRSGQNLIEYAKPLMTYVPWLYRLVRVLAGANPATLGLSVILFELIKKAGFQVSVEAMERYFKSLIKEFLTAIGQEAANVYGGTYGRRSKDWVVGAEAVHLAREASESREMLEAVMRLLDGLDLRDELDRRALQRGLVTPRFDPGKADWLALEDRTAVVESIETLFEAHPSAMQPKALAAWKDGLETRLGHRSRLNVEGGTVHDQVQIESVAHSLVAWGRARGASAELVKAQLGVATTLLPLNVEERTLLLDTVWEEVSGAAGQDPPLPRFDLTEDRKTAYIDDLIELMGSLRPWGPEPDFGFLDDVARRFRLDPAKLRNRVGARYVSVLAELLDDSSPARKLKPGAAYAALVALEPEERWDFAEENRRIIVPDDASKDDKKVLRDVQRELGRKAVMWLLVSRRRAVLLRKAEIKAFSPASSEVVWEGRFSDPSVRVDRSKGWRRKVAAVCGGDWTLPPHLPPLPVLCLEVGPAAAERITIGLEDPTDRAFA